MHHLILVLAEAKHDAGLCHAHTLLLRVLKNTETLPEVCTSISNERRERLPGLNVVGVHIEAGLRDDSNMLKISGEVARQCLDQDMRGPRVQRELEKGVDMISRYVLLLDLHNGFGKMVSSAISKVCSGNVRIINNDVTCSRYHLDPRSSKRCIPNPND